MKRLFQILFITLAVVSCDDDQPLIGEGECFEVSLVEEFCGQAVLKIENSTFYEFGESANGHHNVFYTLLRCKDMGIKDNESFLIEIVEELDFGECGVCQALLDYNGEKKYKVRIVDVCKED